jgi:tripartite-type tricarboxylate transporter receptor subunit TctC
MEMIDRRNLSRTKVAGALARAVAGACLLAAAGAAAAADYPTRTVTIVVPSTPGGTLDRASRLLGERLAERLGQAFVVEPRPGAGAIIGAQAVAKAEPDGYTLLMSSSAAHVLIPILRKQIPYDPLKDFVPLALVAHAPWVLVVHPSLPVHSVQDLIKLAKEKAGALDYASGGPGNPAHIYAELLKSMTGIEMRHVPYKGVSAALNDIVGGHVPLMFSDLLPALPLINGGKLRGIAVTSAERSPSAPQLPTVAESGVPGFNAVGWAMMVAPANTPKEIVAKLHSELKGILARPETKEWLIKNGLAPTPAQSPEQLQEFAKAELSRWRKVLQQIGIAGSQ